MAIYTYKCEKCEREIQKVRKPAERKDSVVCECGGSAEFCLPVVDQPTILETRDKYHNKKVRKGIEEALKKRAKEYFVENEMKEQIEKQGIESAKRFGWVKKNGKPITKEDLK